MIFKVFLFHVNSVLVKSNLFLLVALFTIKQNIPYVWFILKDTVLVKMHAMTGCYRFYQHFLHGNEH